jgi:hypothetical protein
MFKRFKKVACPYCKKKLYEAPKKNRICPHCGELIYVKAGVHDREKALVTADEAKEIDMEWDEFHKQQKLFS